jgi:hypothetical protein
MLRRTIEIQRPIGAFQSDVGFSSYVLKSRHSAFGEFRKIQTGYDQTVWFVCSKRTALLNRKLNRMAKQDML